MIDLVKYFQIPFEDPEISFAEFLLFTEDAMARLKRQNEEGPDAGAFTALVDATQPLFDAFNDAMSDHDDVTASREGGTMTKDQALEAFQLLVRRREGAIRSEFGKPSAQYEEFFPRGLREYSRATMSNAEVLMDRMVTKTTKYQALLGAAIVTEFTNARAAFMSARAAQLNQKGDVSGAADARWSTRAALERQTTVNLMTVAIKYLGQPEKVLLFYNQSILEEPESEEEETPVVPPVPPPAPAP